MSVKSNQRLARDLREIESVLSVAQHPFPPGSVYDVLVQRHYDIPYQRVCWLLRNTPEKFDRVNVDTRGGEYRIKQAHPGTIFRVFVSRNVRESGIVEVYADSAEDAITKARSATNNGEVCLPSRDYLPAHEARLETNEDLLP